MPAVDPPEPPAEDPEASAAGPDLLAAADLVPQLYAELRRCARAMLLREADARTLQPTALVHEAFLRLMPGDGRWQGPAHFFGAAARAMRRILVERARRRRRRRHGGGLERTELDTEACAGPMPDEQLLQLDEALRRFEQQDPRRGEVVHLRHFAGLTLEETAQVLGVSLSTVKADWAFARAWLRLELEAGVDGRG
jgi:RNA polymerase sigma factor (TIGR02999 family)